MIANFKSYSKAVETALKAVKEAAMLCRSIGDEAGANTLEETDRPPVWAADFGSQALILKNLYEVFPGVSVVAEESSSTLKEPENSELLETLVTHVKMIRPQADPDAVLSWIDWGKAEMDPDHFWTLDPLDGTKGFLRRDQFAISLCLVVKGDLSVAVVGCPRLAGSHGEMGTVFFAVKGEGAFELPISLNAEPKPVKVSEVWAHARVRITESVEPAHTSHADTARIAEHLGFSVAPFRLDSQVKYATVARGSSEAYLEIPANREHRDKIWDHASGVLLVQEAGGKVTDIEGRPLDFRLGRTLANNLGVIATNGKVHDAILEAIRNLGIGEL